MTGTIVDNTRAPEPVVAALRDALADHQAGRLAEARARYRQVLSIEPGEPDAFNLLGLLVASTEAADLAAALVERAVALDGQAALFRFNLGVVLSSAGRTEEAARTYERALDLQPDHEGAARNLGIARVHLAASPEAVARSRRRWGTEDNATYHPIDARRRAQSGPGYLLIRGWGCGFWGEVNHVAVQLALADIMGRIPVVFWGSELRYRAPGIENAWEGYFEPVSETTIAALGHETKPCFPGHWTAANLRTSHVRPLLESGQRNIHGVTAIAGLNRFEPVVVADGYNEMGDVVAWAAPGHRLAGMPPAEAFRRVFATQIRLRPDMRARIDDLRRGFFTDSPILAVHYRAQHRDKEAESLEKTSISMETYFQNVDRFIGIYPNIRIFLLSDLLPAIGAFQDRYGERLMALPRQRLTHTDQFDLGLDQSRDGHQLALEVIEDAYLATACDFFLGDGASGVSCSIVALKNWPEGRVHLLRRNVFNERRGRRY